MPIHRRAQNTGTGLAQRSDGGRISGRFDTHHITRLHQHPQQQVKTLLGAGGHQYVAGSTANAASLALSCQLFTQRG
ncbi:hypothetical protein D3C71_1308060 [compost metagenome]